MHDKSAVDCHDHNSKPGSPAFEPRGLPLGYPAILYVVYSGHWSFYLMKLLILRGVWGVGTRINMGNRRDRDSNPGYYDCESIALPLSVPRHIACLLGDSHYSISGFAGIWYLWSVKSGARIWWDEDDSKWKFLEGVSQCLPASLYPAQYGLWLYLYRWASHFSHC